MLQLNAQSAFVPSYSRPPGLFVSSLSQQVYQWQQGINFGGKIHVFSKAFFHGKMASFFQKQFFMKMRGDEMKPWSRWILSTIFIVQLRKEDRRDGKRGVEYCIFWMAYYTNGVVVVAGAIELLLGWMMGETQDFTFCCCYGVFKWERERVEKHVAYKSSGWLEWVSQYLQFLFWNKKQRIKILSQSQCLKIAPKKIHFNFHAKNVPYSCCWFC